MHVRYEPALPDLSYMVRAPLWVDVAGTPFWADRWSLEGILRPEGCTLGSGVAYITFPFQSFWITFTADLEYDPTSGLLLFRGLGQREAETLRHFYRQIATGRAVTMDRMVVAMDAPVDKVPMEQSAREVAASAGRVAPRRQRTIAALAVWAVFALIAFGPFAVAIHDGVSATPAAAATVPD